MRCLIAILTILLTLSAAQGAEVKFCFLFCVVEQEPPVDSFCQAYQQVNRSAEDAADIKRMTRRDARVRLTANDVLYLCKCKGWENPICKEKTE